LEAEVGDDALDAALADGEVLLNQLLGDDCGGAVGIEETLRDDASDDFGGAAVIGFGAGWLGLEGLGTALAKGGQQLVVALAAVAKARGNLDDRAIGALASDEHGELLGQRVRGIDDDFAAGSMEAEGIRINGEGHGEREDERRFKCPINYGGLFEGAGSRFGNEEKKKLK